MPITFSTRVARDDLAFGVVVLAPLATTDTPSALREALGELAKQRRDSPLPDKEEQRRRASRDVLRNGSYKPTGRGKPASEYLLRAAREDQLPSINGPVDANNLISLLYMVPVSVWDLDRAGGECFAIRLGTAGERYVFNSAGQELELLDLVCGVAEGSERNAPIVTPVKDSLATKIHAQTERVAGLIYFPLGELDELEHITAEFARSLEECARPGIARWGVLEPGGHITL
jgi:DNA/RNA-binding domain of Phe-tRNA-synthetase-like protein